MKIATCEGVTDMLLICVSVSVNKFCFKNVYTACSTNYWIVLKIN